MVSRLRLKSRFAGFPRRRRLPGRADGWRWLVDCQMRRITVRNGLAFWPMPRIKQACDALPTESPHGTVRMPVHRARARCRAGHAAGAHGVGRPAAVAIAMPCRPARASAPARQGAHGGHGERQGPSAAVCDAPEAAVSTRSRQGRRAMGHDAPRCPDCRGRSEPPPCPGSSSTRMDTLPLTLP